MLGFMTRTSIKVLAHNISFLINKFMRNDDSMAKIKILVFGQYLQMLIFIRYLKKKSIYFICKIILTSTTD